MSIGKMLPVSCNKSRFISHCIVLFACLSLAACSGGNVAKVRYKGNYYYGEDSTSKYIVVQKGQTLLQIAIDNNLKLSELARLNGINSPYNIYLGQKIRLPTELYHIVKNGETMLRIAALYGVSADSIAAVNGITKPYKLYASQRLIIPISSAVSRDPYEDVNVEGQGVPTDSIIEESTISQDQPKQEHTQNNTTTSHKQALPGDAYEEDLIGSLEKELRAESAGQNSKARPSIYRVTTPIGSNDFTWPISEENGVSVTSHYGQKTGKFAEGISISAPLNSVVSAASSGEVIYVGNDVDGYGKMIIIKHNNDILSAYAHNSSVLVRKGDKVVKGQAIAKVGKTGDVDQPQLYFSLRKGKTTINPEKIIN